MSRAIKILIALFTLLCTLALLAVAGYFYLQYELERTPSDAAELAVFFARPAQRPEFASDSRQPCRDNHPMRNAYFGALHIHTAASFDAAAFGVTNSADGAYAFARGKPVEYRLSGDPPGAEVPIVRIDRALDFAAVTDHAGKLGERRICLDPRSAGYKALVCKVYRGDLRLPMGETMQPLIRLASQAIFSGNRSARVCGDGGAACRIEARSAWEENQRASENWYDRSGDWLFFVSFVTFTVHRHNDVPVTRLDVAFKMEDLLPGPQDEIATVDGNRQRWPKHCGLQMRMSVSIEPRAFVTIVAVWRHQLIQDIWQVLLQTGLELNGPQRARAADIEQVHDTRSDARIGNDFLRFRSDVVDITVSGGIQSDLILEDHSDLVVR